jgi:hypothetical protein
MGHFRLKTNNLQALLPAGRREFAARRALACILKKIAIS